MIKILDAMAADKAVLCYAIADPHPEDDTGTKGEDAPPEYASEQVKFRLKRPRSREGHGAKSGGSSSRKSLGAAAGGHNNGKMKTTDGANNLSPGKRAAIKEKDGEGKYQEQVRNTEGKPKPPFSDSEFACLFVILRFDREVRAASHRSGQVKDKDQNSRGNKSRGF